jgi:sporadic carbohydrate cluster 2OG-Fe(II) oxygenase
VNTGFLDPDEAATTAAFLEAGHLIVDVEDRDGLDGLRYAVAELAAAHLGLKSPPSPGEFLDGIHTRVDAAALNDLRLAVIDGINALPWARECYFGLARNALELLVGNELAMQRRLNLSIQLPGDDSSLLPVHADVWSGDSPFEIVLWLPLVDCHATKSMFLLPPDADAAASARLGDFDGRGAEDLYRAIEPDLIWIGIPYGRALLFTQNLMHGNRLNREGETRWSMNCRFKSLFSPYADKRLGEFFEPITIRAASRLGMAYSLPDDFRE